MILQALTRYYEDLLSRGEIAAPGWAPAKISLALYINENGELTQIVPTMDEVSKGKKTVFQPQLITLPAAVKRTVSIAANFLWDNSAYLLGIDQKGDPERSLKCFAAAAKLHHAVLDSVDSPNGRAILAFFDTWKPEHAAEHPALIRQLDDVTAGGNLVFRVDGRKVEEDAAIREAWQRYRDGGESGVLMQCLVTGKEDEIAAVHPSVKGVRDAQSSGAALVSFNASAFCSYGREQNYNAPVGKYAAFAYTAALNHLLADSDHVQHIGDTTVVCWAEGAEDIYQSFGMAALFGGEVPGLSDNDLRAALKRLANGLPCDDLGVDPNRPFYILGLAPNAARLSVRFFLRDSFGKLMENVNAHYARLEIAGVKYSILPLWALLNATVRDFKKQVPSPVVSGATLRAVFSGTPYPVSLMEAVLLRIRAERNITWGKAAIIKAYYLKNPHEDCPKEVLTVSLNEASTNPAYTLGRLFSVYEAVQQAANPGINATIKDKYFNSAAAMPASIFPVLNNLCQKHLRKLDARQRVYYDKQIMKLKGVLNENYPARMTLAQQGSFDLGYYHQTQKRYTKKEEKENV
jgi:CRISPR-associated protein Csd1